MTSKMKPNPIFELLPKTLQMLTSGKSPLSLLHEICAKNKLDQPVIEVNPIEDGAFLFLAKAVYENVVFSSIPAPRKQDAKNDVAVKIIDYFNNRSQGKEDEFQTKTEVKDSSVESVPAMIGEKLVENKIEGFSSLFELAQNEVYRAILEVSFFSCMSNLMF